MGPAGQTRNIDVVVCDILGTMVDEPSGIRRGLRTLLPDADDARADELLHAWYRHVDDQQQDVIAGRRPYANSSVIDLEAATRVAAVGMRTAYVERPVGDPPGAEDSFDLYAKSLEDLAAILDTG